MNYLWNNEPIEDIHAWAREHGHQMVRVRHTWNEPRVLESRFVELSEEMEMPAPFFDGLRFGGPRNDQYAEIERYDP